MKQTKTKPFNKKEVEIKMLRLDIELLQTLDKQNKTNNSITINRLKKTLNQLEK
jgi:hypothetical protein